MKEAGTQEGEGPAVQGTFCDYIQGARDQLGTLMHDQENAQEEVGKPFPQEEELRAKSARLVELDTLLNMDGQRAEPIAGEEYADMEPVIEGPEVKPSINEV